ncbi:MAG: 1-deoxy-D-xylulose-5-phosphate reductoisomerase, partial [Lachnospiraceae bacterium]|nr:1-deoxy-D-xylulose-5-phosphate reductoisomerase [Lachnospiraceae bacterium]
MKHIAVLGSTGSIGTQTLDVVRKHPEMMDVVALACGSRIDLIEKQAREFCPEIVAVYDEKAASDLAVRLADTNVKVLGGMDGLIEMCRIPTADVVVTAIVGMIGIRPTIAAIEAGKDIALANKETCVCAGHIILPLAAEKGVKILPVDSEHSAIFQALQGRAGSQIRRILLTASGGPFRGRTREELMNVTAAQALAHPTWSMGPKITVDSASMVNKGLEVIEAKWLFDVDVDQIEVVIQPQSIIHSAVEYEDGSILAQMGPSDMRIAIQYALTYPLHLPSPAVPLDFRTLAGLELGVPDNETFRGLPLAISAIRTGGSMPVVFNASNEWANAIFRRGDISFLQIYDVIEDTMSRHSVIAAPTVDEIFAVQDEIDAYCEEKY